MREPSLLRGTIPAELILNLTFVLNSFRINETHDGLIVQDLKLMSLHNVEQDEISLLQNRFRTEKKDNKLYIPRTFKR